MSYYVHEECPTPSPQTYINQPKAPVSNEYFYCQQLREQND
jgi:hypothetical protein